MTLKDWLLKRYLPSWAVLEYRDRLEAAQKRVQELETENHTLRAYINGVERGLRAKQAKVVLRGGTADECDREGVV